MSEERGRRHERLMAAANRSLYYQHIGMKVIQMGEGRATLTMPVEKKLFHAGGFTQGGAIASVADGATAYALFSILEPGEDITTVELKINYLRPVNKGELRAESNVVHKGKRIAVADVEVRNDDGKLVAKGMSTMMILQNGRSAFEGDEPPGSEASR